LRQVLSYCTSDRLGRGVEVNHAGFISIDKALVAAIMGILFIVQTYTGLQLPWLTPDTIATIIGLITPVLLWAIPNKKIA
jgi:hypothetical protein